MWEEKDIAIIEDAKDEARQNRIDLQFKEEEMLELIEREDIEDGNV